MNSVRVTGQTFDHRDRLKQLGGRWDGQAKNWVFDWIGPKDLAELKNLPGCLVVGDTTPAVERKNTDEGARELIERILAGEDDAEETPVDGKNNTVIYGDDQTYFNYFRDKNPISFFGFSSLHEMTKFIKAIPPSKREGDRSAGYEKGKWHGSEDMEEALQIAKDGWKEGAEKAATILDFLSLEHAVQRRRAYAVAGGNVSVGRLLAGNPKHMIERPKLPGRRNVTLFAENTASSLIKPEMLIVRAAIIAAFADILEQQGYSCTIVAATMQTHWSKPGAQTAVTVKHAGEKLNLDDAVFALGHPSFLRRFNFACVCQADEMRSIWSTQGSPRSAFNRGDMKQNEFYVPHLKNNIKGDSFEEIAKQMLPLIMPPGLPMKMEIE